MPETTLTTANSTTTAPLAPRGTQARRYGDGHGVVLTPAGTDTVTDLDRAALVGVLAESGFVLLRDFEPDLESFSTLVSSHSRRVTLDPARRFFGGQVAQRVDNGTDALGLHIENGNSPFAPDLTWFLCEKAPRRGSQTTVCDGYRVWDALSASTREVFDSEIVYTRNISWTAWTTFVRHQNPDIGDREITFDDLLDLVNEPDQVIMTDHSDGSVTYVFRTGAAHHTLFGERLAFANSLLGPSYNYQPPVITLQRSGRELPAEVLDEVATVTAACTENLDWHDGDIALIDNTRVMHGRREILDEDRTIYNAQSYIDQALL